MADLSPTPLPFESQVQVSQTPSESSLLSFLFRLPVAFILGGIIVVVSGLLWGVLAYLTESIYFMVAIVIGIGVTYALTFPFKRVPFLLALLLLLPAIALTIVAVLWGDYVFYTLLAMNARGLDPLRAMEWVASYFIQAAITEDGESLSSLVFAVIGAVLGFFSAVRR